MRHRAWVMCALLMSATACGNPETPDTEDANDDNATPLGNAGTGGNAGAAGAPGITLQPGATYLRLVNLAPGAGAIDFCFAPKGSDAYVGPVLKSGTPEQPGAVKASGVVFTKNNYAIERDELSSPYARTEAGSYDFRIVAAGASGCGSPLAQIDDAPDMLAGQGGTVTLMGEKDTQLARVFVDEFPTDVEAVRFVNAAEGSGRYDLRLGEGLLSRPLHTGVARGNQGQTRGSRGGYVAVSSWKRPPFSIGITNKSQTAVHLPTRFSGGGNSVYLVGAPGSSTFGLRAVVCADGLNGSRCEIMGQDVSQVALTTLRFVQMTAGGGEPFREPIFCAGPMGGPYLQRNDLGSGRLTRYAEAPAGTWRMFMRPTGQNDCSKPENLLADATFDLQPDTHHTVMLVGGEGTGAPVSFALLKDKLHFLPTQAAIRFVHVAESTPAMMAGVGKGDAFVRLFNSVSYGHVATGSMADPDGYVTFAGMENGHVTARAADNADKDVAARDDMFIRHGETWTVFVVRGRKFNSEETEVQLMACIDSEIPLSSRTGCRDARSGL